MAKKTRKRKKKATVSPDRRPKGFTYTGPTDKNGLPPHPKVIAKEEAKAAKIEKRIIDAAAEPEVTPELEAAAEPSYYAKKYPGKAPPDPKADDGHFVTLGADHPSLPDPQPDGGRGEFWNYPPTSLRCKASSKQRTNEARRLGLIEDPEVRRCRRPVTAGKEVCRYHGGITKEGWSGGVITSGRYTKRLGPLRDAYLSSMNDASLFDLTEPMAVLDSIVKRNMERLEERDTPDFRKRARELFAEITACADADEREGKIDALGAHLERGESEDRALNDLTKTVVSFQKRLEEAWKIKLTRDETMNVRDLVGILGKIANIVFDECGVLVNEDGERVGDIIGTRFDEFLGGLGKGRK